MRIFPKGTLALFNGGTLPRYDPEFRPSWLWTNRAGRVIDTVITITRQIVFPFWRTAVNHVVCGSTGVGKSTLIYFGLMELAEAGVYLEDDLSQLDKPANTENPSRFTIEREGIFEGVDSWIDIKGEDFTDTFSLGINAEKKNPLLEAFLEQVNAIVIVVSAQQLLDVYRRRDSPSKGDRNLIDGFTQRINDLHPTVLKALKRGGFSWHFVVNQCADVLGGSASKYTELVTATRHFSDKTGFNKACRTALLCDCKPSAAAARGIKVASISVGPRGGLGITRQGVAKVCSSGVALGIVLSRIRHRASDHHFIIPLKSK